MEELEVWANSRDHAQHNQLDLKERAAEGPSVAFIRFMFLNRVLWS